VLLFQAEQRLGNIVYIGWSRKMARRDGRCDKCNCRDDDLVVCSICDEEVCKDHRQGDKCISCIANGK